MDLYPYTFTPVYKEKIWGGENLARLFGRDLPAEKIGESWELADLEQGVSVVDNGPLAGTSLTELTAKLGRRLLGKTKPLPNGRFPLLLKLLDANDMLSLQVHPDEQAVEHLGGDAALKTECWYMVESRDGFIYKGVQQGVSPDQFRQAIESETCEKVCRKIDVATGDFHYLPAGIVHAIGPGLVVAEVQTPSDTTYRVTDWGRGREIHVDKSMECIRFDLTGDNPPGSGDDDKLLETDYFTVYNRTLQAGQIHPMGRGCTPLMVLSGKLLLEGDPGPVARVEAPAGRTVLVPAHWKGGLRADEDTSFLEISLPEDE